MIVELRKGMARMIADPTESEKLELVRPKPFL